ncbi:winged helix-turn-helix domain-containing protein [Thalassotalea sp. ND16A]|uniref:winged helix-turn-helix domain-containing protein n=1 Tax=Thalassotalea sp. ND16A TaxID=1535422 RepID=UPI00051D43FB|nr:winged helix-turn-helix domain-containing protein [Thalassotalea sp. ND16A]KGK00523.1 putative transcriptional regulator, CadC [Thalassotalea sp. ND16A]
MISSSDQTNKTVGEFVVDFSLGKLFKQGVEIKLEPQSFELLRLFLTQKGRVVSREEILTNIWANRHVSDDAIRAVVKKLRLALGDDARNPTYIKTLPLKGYTLIAEVTDIIEHTPIKQAQRVRSYLLTFISLLALTLLSLWFFHPDDKSSHAQAQPQIEFLTHMSGSELSADYSQVKDALVFSHRANNNDALNLYIKNLESKRIQRLTWGDANYANALWSPDGHSIIYIRSDSAGSFHYLASLDQDNAVLASEVLDSAALQGKYVIAWSAGNDAVYVKSGYRNFSAQGISRYHLATGKLNAITSPSVAGAGDYFAKESFDGKLLAILRGVSADKHELLILDINTGTLLANRVMPVHANRLVWSGDNSRLILSGFRGELFEYSIAKDSFLVKTLNADFINDVIYHCGNECYYMRQHNGNFLDIQEQPNPFVQQTMLASEHIDLSGAEDFPLYNANGDTLYFISLENDKLVLQKQQKNLPVEQLSSFSPDSKISALVINQQESKLAGVIGKRIFIFDLQSKSLNFITSDLELVHNPTWHPDGDKLFYASVEDKLHSIYLYSLQAKKKVAWLKGYIAIRQYGENNYIAIKENLEAWLLSLNNDKEFEATKLLGKVGSASPNLWQIANGYLYFNRRTDVTTVMTRINIDTGKQEVKQLAKNRFRLNFAIHPRVDKILVVKSLLAESNLVKISVAK